MSEVGSPEPSSSSLAVMTEKVSVGCEDFSVRTVTALYCCSIDKAVGFSVLNIDEAVGVAVCSVDISVVCSSELPSSVVGKVELFSDVAESSSP